MDAVLHRQCIITASALLLLLLHLWYAADKQAAKYAIEQVQNISSLCPCSRPNKSAILQQLDYMQHVSLHSAMLLLFSLGPLTTLV